MRAVILASLTVISPPLLCLTATNASQTPSRTAPLTLRLGQVSVNLPAPEGFEEAASQVEMIRKYFSVTEAPANEMLAVHLPASDLERQKRGEPAAMTFYTKVSIYKKLKEADF